MQIQELKYREDKKKLFHETFFEMEKAYLPSTWGKNVVASEIIYSLFDDYDQPKLSLAVSNMTVTCGYHGWLECHRPALRFARSTLNRKCYSTRLSSSQGLFRVSAKFRYRTKNLKIVLFLFYFFHIQCDFRLYPVGLLNLLCFCFFSVKFRS